MKRVLFASAACLFSLGLVGCTSDSHEGLVSETIEMLDNATTAIKNITKQVETAVETAEKNNQKLDLSKAMAETKKLKKTGEDAQFLKKRIEEQRAQITDENRKAYAEKKKAALNDAFKALLRQKDDLRKALANAENRDGQFKDQFKAQVKELRERLVEAEGPFEALSR